MDQLGIQATQGLIFILVSENAFFPMYATLALIPQELPLLRREYRAGMYSIHLYYVARMLSLASRSQIFPQIKYKVDRTFFEVVSVVKSVLPARN